jgi:hypothetical protein
MAGLSAAVIDVFHGGAYALAPLTQASDGLLYGYSHVISAGTIEGEPRLTGGPFGYGQHLR